MKVKKDWFESVAKKNFEFVFNNLTIENAIPQRILQIGVYTGDATKWISNNILSKSKTSELHDVDTWEGSPEPEHQILDWQEVEKLYDETTQQLEHRSRIFKHKTTSDSFFKNTNENEKYDFIYVDGHHFAEYVARDAFNSFQHLNQNGILAFDDYGYGQHLKPEKKPAAAIDFFLMAYQNQYSIIVSNYQIWIQKNEI